MTHVACIFLFNSTAGEGNLRCKRRVYKQLLGQSKVGFFNYALESWGAVPVEVTSELGQEESVGVFDRRLLE